VIETLTSWAHGLFGDGWGWTGQIFGVVLATLTLHALARFVLAWIRRRYLHAAGPWPQAVLEAAVHPATTLIWVHGLAYAANLAGRHTDAPIFEAVEPLREIAVIVLAVWFLIGFIRRAEVNLVRARELAGRPLDPTSVDAISKLLRGAVVITAVLVVLQTLGYSISGLLAFGGLGGIIAGLAARDVLANLFGGLTVYLDRPFAVGDWVRSPDRELEGVVEEIGWRRTVIRSFDKRPIYVPNAAFSTIVVVNPSRMTARRIYESVGLRYADQAVLPTVLADVRRMLTGHQEIDSDQIQMVNFDRFGESALELFVYCYTYTTEWARFHEIKEDVLLRIAEIVHGHGAEVAFPTRTIHMAGNAAEPILPGREA